MLHIKGAIIVEGRYDKARLKNIVDCPVIVTNGFGVFNNKDTVSLIKYYADNGGIIILTDSDSAGFRIRGRIKGFVAEEKIKNAYIPDIYGKEKRKRQPSKEGKLGVEGIPDDVLISALSECVELSPEDREEERITRLDLYEDGLTGGKNSSERRKKLLALLCLPERLPPNSLLDAINQKLTKREYKALVEKIISEGSGD